MLTLSQVQNSSRIQRVIGMCPTSQDAIDLINDADRMLVTRGNWAGSTVKICTCTYSNQIVWPRQVLVPLAINSCNRTVMLHNHWYNFEKIQRDDLVGYWGAGCCGNLRGVQGNAACVFNPISAQYATNGVYLRFYPSALADVGKTIVVYGVDSNGTELRSTYPDGTVQDGVPVSLALPFATLDVTGLQSRNVPTIRRVTRIVKDITDGPVYAYQYDAANDLLLDLGYYEATETNPSYETSSIAGQCAINSQGKPSQVTALVSVKHIDASNPNDLLVIDNFDAFALAIQALKLGDAYSMDDKRKAEGEAVRELNLELRKRLPLDQIPVEMSPFGTALPRRHSIGRIT